jgi:hypothetical protein
MRMTKHVPPPELCSRIQAIRKLLADLTIVIPIDVFIEADRRLDELAEDIRVHDRDGDAQR